MTLLAAFFSCVIVARVAPIADSPIESAALPDYTPQIFRLLLTLGVLCLVLVAALWYVRRTGRSRVTHAGKIVLADRLELGQGRGIVLVVVSGRQQLLGVTPQSITLLASEGLSSAGVNSAGTTEGAPPDLAGPSKTPDFSVVPGTGQSQTAFAAVFRNTPFNSEPPAASTPAPVPVDR